MEISFCIPTYNRAKYLKRCVASILAHNDPDIEVIVQDNNSTDNTAQIMESFHDARLSYYRNERNIGGVKNIIKIVGRASGRYVYFLTDDAYLLPDVISKIKTFIHANDPAFFISDIEVLFEKQNKTINLNFFKESIDAKTPVDKKTAARIIFAARFLPRVCYKRELLDYDLLKKHGDNWYPHLLIGFQMAMKGPVLYLAEPIVSVNVENEGFGFPEDMDETDRGAFRIIAAMQDYLDYEIIESFVLHFARILRLISEDMVILLKPETQAIIREEATTKKFRVF